MPAYVTRLRDQERPMMDALFEDKPAQCGNTSKIVNTSESTSAIPIQFALSLLLAIPGFVAFCILRPRWPTLYAARKRRLDPKIGPPTLPNTFFGWMPVLYRVTEEQVLASAGLDAFVFLSFFKTAIRILSIMAFFAYTVILPINVHFDRIPEWGDSDPTAYGMPQLPENYEFSLAGSFRILKEDRTKDFLWAYLVFLYFFTGVTLYILNKETVRIIHVRQEYLGSQSTITDRTLRISGVPHKMRSEDKIKSLIENLNVGQVESVSLVRDWRELDSLMEKRKGLLGKLEESWSVFLGKQAALPKTVQRLRDPQAEPSVLEPREDEVDEEAGENGRLLGHGELRPEYVDRKRPKVRLWYGFLKFQSRKVDAIDYYEEKLRRLDEQIYQAREKDYAPTAQAFVTMDSIAACQMLIQARIDPRPGQFLSKPAPSPTDVMWPNTYAPRGIRRLRSWTITIFVAILSVLWVAVLTAIAGILNYCNFSQQFSSVVRALENFPLLASAVQYSLTTGLVTLLNFLVPYLYWILSYQQGMISKGDVELSVVSKNFFFTFVNIFLVLSISSSAFGIAAIFDDVKKSWGSPDKMARLIGSQIERMGVFYTNFIMLQGLGLFPVRLAEFGSVFYYFLQRLGAKTPRDFADIMEPPVFTYGLYLPTALLVFMLCQIYSTLSYSPFVLTVGLVYFVFGYFTYKYQLLYAMDQPQHATGGAWRLIAYRIILGLVVSEVILSSFMAVQTGWVQSILVLPLIVFTIWYSFYFARRFEPLTRVISLRSIRSQADADEVAVVDEDFEGPRPAQGLLRRGSTIDEDKEKGKKFINPSLTSKLEQPWIYQDPPPTSDVSDEESGPAESPNAPANTSVGASDSSMSLGDTHIWRQQTDNSNK
ncbi:Calcium permeable stress-gated cation channel 1 [Colletotrichum spinosum]|uniref:Calcium permeable stress-gated cation channel 1 n=1 Tax=Colletotrichum spinosum TaxID=1347390 RepID=A0A4R8PMP3_9PEZI|nr:Calcium permeable stress-gated cation channel 1 [Colletotrichum spinosum]